MQRSDQRGGGSQTTRTLESMWAQLDLSLGTTFKSLKGLNSRAMHSYLHFKSPPCPPLTMGITESKTRGRRAAREGCRGYKHTHTARYIPAYCVEVFSARSEPGAPHLDNHATYGKYSKGKVVLAL